jgi:uncharacterized protein YbjQ (UPF0145 family)
MDTPFSDDKSPFLAPYPPPGPASPGIKPFTAVDLVPPPGQGSRNLPAPQASPFLDKAKPAAPRPAAGPTTLPDPLHPIPASSLSQVFAPAAPPAPPGFAFAGKPPVPDFLAPKPTAARENPVPKEPSPAAAPGPAGGAGPFGSPHPLGSPGPAGPAAAAAASAVPPIPLAVAPAPSIPAKPVAPPAPPVPAPASASAALGASATARRGSASEIIAKPSLAMTDSDAAPGSLVVTSGPSAEGRRIAAYLGMVSAEIVIPKDVLFRNPAPYGELHRIKAAEEQLQRVQRKAFEDLAERARALGADGIVGASLQYSQIDAVAFLCAALGTAVKFS